MNRPIAFTTLGETSRQMALDTRAKFAQYPGVVVIAKSLYAIDHRFASDAYNFRIGAADKGEDVIRAERNDWHVILFGE